MRFYLFITLLASLPCISHVAGQLNHLEALISPYDADFGLDGQPWSGMAACKRECTRLQQKSVLHDVHYDAEFASFLTRSAEAALGACLVAAVGAVFWLLKSRAKDRESFASRERELLERCRGIMNQAADLGEKASNSSQQLEAQSLELKKAHVKLQVANLLLREKTQADPPPTPPTSTVSTQYQAEGADAAPDEPPLEGECSTPQLDELVAGAAGPDTTKCTTDTAKCSSDQYINTTPVASKALSSKPQDQPSPLELLASSRTTPIPRVVDLLNQRLAEEGQSDRLQVFVVPSPGSQASPQVSKAAVTSPSPAAAASPAPSASSCPPAAAELPVPSPAAAAGSSPQMQQQQQLVGSSPAATSTDAGSRYVTHDELQRTLLKKDVEHLSEKKGQLVEEVTLLRAEKQALSGGLVGSGFVTTSRGSGTPLPFAGVGQQAGPSPWVGRVSPLSPPGNAFQQFSPLRSSGVPEVSNTASSSCFKGFMPAPGSQTAGSVGSNRQTSPLQQSPPGAGSAASCVSGRASQLEPLPMQSLEGGVSPEHQQCSPEQQQQPRNNNSAAAKLKEALDKALDKAGENARTSRVQAEKKHTEAKEKAVRLSPVMKEG